MRPLYLIAVIGTRLITVLSTLSISYLLNPTQFGYYALTNTNALFVQMLFGAWLTSIANRILATEHALDNETLSSIASGFALIFFGIALSFGIYTIVLSEYTLRLALVAVLALMLILYDTTLAIQNAAGQERGYTRLSIFRNCLSFILSIALVMTGFGFAGAIVGQIIGTITPLVTTPSVLRLWSSVRPSGVAIRRLFRHLPLGIAGAATLGIYILTNAPSRNIMEHSAGAASVGVWALCCDLFYGPLAVIGNAYGLSQIRLMYLAAQAGDDDALALHARDLVEFTLAVAVPYAVGGTFFGAQIVSLAFPSEKIADAVEVITPAILQGAALLVLYSLASVALARQRFGLIVVMVLTTAAAATLAAWTKGTMTHMAWSSAIATIVCVSSWVIWSALCGLVRPRLSEITKLVLAMTALASAAMFSVQCLTFAGGWIAGILIAGGIFVAVALWLRLAALIDALPRPIRLKLIRTPIAKVD